MLTEDERTRYRRQLILHGWSEETQEKLKNTTVFVGGAGGSGSPILTQLALLGIGTIRICDFDTIELSNLNRQFIHCVSDKNKIGINKAQSAACTVKNINPHVNVEVFEERIVYLIVLIIFHQNLFYLLRRSEKKYHTCFTV
jgi:adenylyltransferase/sulfurtransferase